MAEKTAEQMAFQRKQEAWASYDEVKKRVNKVHNALRLAWKKRCTIREEMNEEYRAMKAADERSDKVWAAYESICERNKAQIESLRSEADLEHSEVQRCFNQVNNALRRGDESMVSYYSREGNKHRDRRNVLNAEINALYREMEEAEQNANKIAPKKANNAGFRAARKRFLHAKKHHEAVQAEFKRLKAERDRLKAEFETVQAECRKIQ